MDGSVERIVPRVRVLPPRQRREGGQPEGRQQFKLPGDSAERESETSPPEEERPLGTAADDEAGARLDVTA